MNVLVRWGDSFLERNGYSFYGFTEIRSEKLCRFVLGYSGDSFWGVLRRFVLRRSFGALR